MRVLLVEDERRVAAFLERGLAEEGHSVRAVRTGAAAVEAAHSTAFDVIILDVGLPDRDGFGVATAIRSQGHATPILMLTARDASDDIVRGLDAGADDYLTKPFDFAELIARLRALTRRATNAPVPLQLGDIQLDRVRHAVTRAGAEVRLTPIEYRILEVLMSARGTVVRRKDLLERVWGMQFDPGTGVLDVHVANLRQKLERRGGPRVIVAVKGVGFRFVED